MDRSFGFYINAMRTARNTSLRDISQDTGIPEEDLRKLVDGSVFASKDQVFRLANYFDASENKLLQLNQAGRITAETAGQGEGGSSKKNRPLLFKNSPLCNRRIDNLKRDLALLEIRPLNVKLHVPVLPLRPFIDSIVYCKGHDLGHPFESTLPDGTAQLQIVIGEGGREVISRSGKPVKRFNRAWVMGMNNTPVTYRLSEVKGVIYVRFKPSGLYAFTRIHQAELNNLVVDASSVFGPSLENLWETLAICYQPKQMISSVEDFFLRRLQTVANAPAMLTYMLDHIDLPLTQLARKTGYSAKYLTKTFQRYVGTGPKTFQRIQRFQKSIGNLNHLSSRVDWAELVFQHGYHDQAHFIKDFRHFSGFSPQNYLALGPSCTRYLHTPHLPEYLL